MDLNTYHSGASESAKPLDSDSPQVLALNFNTPLRTVEVRTSTTPQLAFYTYALLSGEPARSTGIPPSVFCSRLYCLTHLSQIRDDEAVAGRRYTPLYLLIQYFSLSKSP